MTSSARRDGGPPESTSSTWSWLLPVLTFLLGCVLGGVVIAAGISGDPQDSVASPGASPGADEGPEDGGAGDPTVEPDPEETVVRVPESCLAAADAAVVASNRLGDVVAAVRDLDARRLQEVVDGVQQQQPQVRELAERCRSTAGERLEDAELAESDAEPEPDSDAEPEPESEPSPSPSS